MATVLNPREQAAQTVILHDVSWSLYEHLLTERGDAPNPRLAYDRGELEIAVPSFAHEQIGRVIADLADAAAAALGLDYINAGSTTFSRSEVGRGFEADTALYIQHADAVRGKDEIDLERDAPPDLVIEVDVTHPSLNNLPIFAGLRIPEVWRCYRGTLAFLVLEGTEYRETAGSRALPGVTSADILRFTVQSAQVKRPDWRQSVEAWARSLSGA